MIHTIYTQFGQDRHQELLEQARSYRQARLARRHPRTRSGARQPRHD